VLRWSASRAFRYDKKYDQLITAYVINNTNEIKAAKTTSRLNLRIRRWYSVAQQLQATEPECSTPTGQQWLCGFAERTASRSAKQTRMLRGGWQRRGVSPILFCLA
jgi:hypothetical protein